MNIIVVGAGKIGVTVIARLVAEGHDVIAIDSDPSVIQQISNVYDVMCVCGNGVDWETLTEAGVKNTELLLAVTGSDEFNMLCCFMAKQLGAPHTIARIRNPEYNGKSLSFIKQTLGLSFSINPDAMAAKELFNLLQLPGAESVETFARRSFEMVEIILKPDSKLNGLTLMEMKKRFPAPYLVGTVQRENDSYIPDGSFRLQSGDRIGLSAAANQIEGILKMLGSKQSRSKNVMIIGAGRCAFYLTKMLLNSGVSVTVIDKDKAACEAFSELVPSAIVCLGDAADEAFLLEEGLETMDAFVSLTGIDQENILISHLAASRGVKKVITKINREEFSAIATKLGLDCIISPRQLIADIVTRYARALDNSKGSQMETLYSLMNGSAEALEFKVLEDFPYVNITLKDMKLKKNTLIAGIIRDKKVIIPGGNDVILPGDSIVVLTSGDRLGELAEMMES